MMGGGRSGYKLDIFNGIGFSQWQWSNVVKGSIWPYKYLYKDRVFKHLFKQTKQKYISLSHYFTVLVHLNFFWIGEIIVINLIYPYHPDILSSLSNVNQTICLVLCIHHHDGNIFLVYTLFLKLEIDEDKKYLTRFVGW